MNAFSDPNQAHKHAGNHRQEIENSQSCGCFYCLSIYAPSHIEDWVDEDENGIGTTALCPECGIDAVLGDRSNYPITESFLETMHKFWF